MEKDYRKRALSVFVMLAVAGVYGKAPLTDVFASYAYASDGEDSSADNEDDNSGSKDENDSEKKAEEKKKESAKKVEQIRREVAKKAAEIKQESAKKADEMKGELEKKRAEAVKKEQEGGDDVSDTEEEVENESEDSESAEKSGDNRYGQAAEKIAEAEKRILEQQADGKDMTIALERLAQAKNMLALAGESRTSGNDDAEELLKESLKLSHTAENEDVHEINDAYKFVKKASDRIDQATKKLSRLAAAGGDVSSYQSMIDIASTDLKSAKDALLQGSLLDSVALSRQAETEAKSAKRAIESALLALGVEDDDLSGDNKSAVAQAVEDLLYVASVEGENGIGKKVREIARAQRDSAEQVDGLIDDAQSRSEFAEFVFGPKYADLNGIQKQIEDNQARIVSLTQTVSDMSDADLKEVVQEHIDALTEENTKLQSFVSGKEKQRGIFGWVFRLLQ